MARISRWIALAFLCLGVAGCGGPFVLLPGGKLEGRDAPTPSDWSSIADVGTVQIETQPSDPYSVNIWVVGIGSVAYLHAGANRANWVVHLESDPSIRMRVDEDIYSLRATRVTTQEEFDRFADAYDEKYSVRPRNENVAEVYLFRLEDA